MNTPLNEKELPTVVLSKKVRWFLLYLLSFLAGVIGITGGVFSSGISKIKSDLSLTDEQLGLVGTFGGFGALVGSIIFTVLINILNNKCFLIMCVVINSIGHFMVFITNNFYVLLVGRCIPGVTSNVLLTFFTVWVNKYAVQKYKTAFFTIYQLLSTLGIIWGYVVNLIIGKDQWRYGFLIEIVLEMSVAVILLFVPGKYFDKNLFFFKHNKEDGRKDKESFNHESLFSPEQKKKESNDDTKETLCSSVICNLFLILLTIVRSFKCFVFIVFIFWYTDYLETQLHIVNQREIFISFSIAQVASSLAGLLLGGAIGSCVGGYTSKKGPLIILIIMLLATIIGVIVPYIDSIYLFTIAIFFFNTIGFIGAPFEINITFDVVPKRYGGITNGLVSTFVNITAGIPAPTIYGYIKTLYGSQASMNFTMRLYILGSIVMLLALCVKNREDRKKEEKEKSNNGIPLQEVKA